MSEHMTWIDLTNESDDESIHASNVGLHVRMPRRMIDSRQSIQQPSPNMELPLDTSAWRRGDHARRLNAAILSSYSPQPTLSSLSVPPHHMQPRQTIVRHEGSGLAVLLAMSNMLTSVPPAKPPRRACVSCLEVKVACDGERPCSACVEPGLACYYPGERPTIPQPANLSSIAWNSRLLKQPSADDEVYSRTRSLFAKSIDTTRQSDLSPNQLLAVAISGNGPRAPKACVEEEQAFVDSDDSDDDDDDVPPSIPELDEVKRLLRKHETRMREHRTYLLQSLFNQSKIDAVRAAKPYVKKDQGSPFAKIIKKPKTSIGTEGGRSSNLQMQTKSHKLGAPRKWSQVPISLRVLGADPTILPKYKSIGRLGANLLAPNIRTLKYWPYFPDEENLDPSEAKKNEELEERYQHDDNHLLAQRKCSELVDLWRPWVKDFVSRLRIEFIDILYWFLKTADKTTCDTCEREILAESFSEASQLLVKPSDRSLSLARFSAHAIDDVVGVSMWHFVLNASSVKDLLMQFEVPKKNSTVLCSVCFTYNCLSHGAYLEPEESGGAVIMGGNVEINDEELNHNIRLLSSVSNHNYGEEHQCGLYCVSVEARTKDILGRGKDGKIGGIHNHNTHVPRLSISNADDCGEHCFWSTEKRTKFGSVINTKDYRPRLSDESNAILRTLVRLYSDNQRAPCMIAKDITELTCMDAFHYILAEMQHVSHYRQAVVNAQQNTRKISKIAAGLDTSLSADLDERPPFVPCSHAGPCLNNPECTCAQHKIHCEWFCGCDKACDRRFPGCKCASTNKMCFNDKACECWKHNRECDPWLCGTCGVLEVLDPQNKYRNDIRGGRCKNNRIQLELPARTIKAPSEVQGWGLYAGVVLEEGAFIGEYKGETVGNQESDRRGAVYANIGQEYLFVMNRDQQIDGSNFGNKTRFINNSQRDDYINVYAKKLLCNGVQRVMLYAKRSIRAGEELLYNYNYPVSVTKKFWERGEGPTSVPGAVVAKPSITWTQPRVNGRFARMTGKQDGEQSPAARLELDGDRNRGEDEWTKARDAKRKRVSDGGLIVANASAPAVAARTGVQESMPKVGLVFPDDPDDSDFELVDASPSSESVDAAEASSDQGEASTSVRRRRVVHASDRRRGGLAQAKAWETRRKRNGKGK